MYDFTPSENFIDRIIVHGGVFHADDVLCAAVAKTINPDVEIQRVFQLPPENELPAGTIVADIGRGTYDHHQPDSKTDPINGHKYAAIGLMLDDDRIFYKLQESLGSAHQDLSNFWGEIIDIENNDNGQKTGPINPVTYLCRNMNPTWDAYNVTADERFESAVNLVKENFIEPMLQGKDMDEYFHTMNEIALGYKAEYERSEKHAQQIVEPALESMENNVVTLPQFAPWDKVLVPSEAEFVIYPSNRGGYNLQCVPPDLDSFEKKVELPNWSENMPEGCTFEHPGRFLASFDTLEHAQAAAREIEKEQLRSEIHKISLEKLQTPEDYLREFDKLNGLERNLRSMLDKEFGGPTGGFSLGEDPDEINYHHNPDLEGLLVKKNEVALGFIKEMTENKEFIQAYNDLIDADIEYVENDVDFYDKILVQFPEELKEDLNLKSNRFTILPIIISDIEKKEGTTNLGEFIKNQITFTYADYQQDVYEDPETGEWLDESDYMEQYPGSPLDLQVRFNNDEPEELQDNPDLYKNHTQFTMEIVKHYRELAPEQAKEIFFEGLSKGLGVEDSDLTINSPEVEKAFTNLIEAKNFCTCFREKDGVRISTDGNIRIDFDNIVSFDDLVTKINDDVERYYDLEEQKDTIGDDGAR